MAMANKIPTTMAAISPAVSLDTETTSYTSAGEKKKIKNISKKHTTASYWLVKKLKILESFSTHGCLMHKEITDLKYNAYYNLHWTDNSYMMTILKLNFVPDILH